MSRDGAGGGVSTEVRVMRAAGLQRGDLVATAVRTYVVEPLRFAEDAAPREYRAVASAERASPRGGTLLCLADSGAALRVPRGASIFVLRDARLSAAPLLTEERVAALAHAGGRALYFTARQAAEYAAGGPPPLSPRRIAEVAREEARAAELHAMIAHLQRRAAGRRGETTTASRTTR